MTLEEFKERVSTNTPPTGLTPALHALWLEARGSWERAHELVQKESDAASAWVHAYLHRKEGDLSNASYWYARAQQKVCEDSLEDEWGGIALNLLTRETLS